jgi:peptidoglycan/xylan/chitin deacetylase (PgdA/CDA1 family)
VPISKRRLLCDVLSASGLLAVLEHLPGTSHLLGFNYHRIGNPEGNLFDDGVLSADPRVFVRQVEYLKRRFRLVDLRELEEILDTGSPVTKPCALISFDDGYRDNYDAAFPVLKAAEVPAVFFVSTRFSEGHDLPWWDHAAYVLKQTGKNEIVLETPENGTVRVSPRPVATALRTLSPFLLACTEQQRQQLLDQMQDHAGVEVESSLLARQLFMNWDQMREMVRSGMQFGSHTHSHSILASLTEDEQVAEMKTSKSILEGRLGCCVSAVSYPRGQPDSFTAVSKRAAQRAGFRLGFSFYGGVNALPMRDRFDIGRLGVEVHDTFPLFRGRCVLKTLWPARFQRL